jgi:hypothetical protein
VSKQWARMGKKYHDMLYGKDMEEEIKPIGIDMDEQQVEFLFYFERFDSMKQYMLYEFNYIMMIAGLKGCACSCYKGPKC